MCLKRIYILQMLDNSLQISVKYDASGICDGSWSNLLVTEGEEGVHFPCFGDRFTHPFLPFLHVL